MSDAAFRARLARLRREPQPETPMPTPQAQAQAQAHAHAQSQAPQPQTGTEARTHSEDETASPAAVEGAAPEIRSPRASATDGPIAPAGPSTGWLAARLTARERLTGTARASDPVLPGPPARLERSACGGFAVRRSPQAAAELHGAWRLDAALAAPAHAIARLARDPRLAALDPSRALYLDIETTGLSGGAGTWPFLVALGSFDAAQARFEVWQGFLASPAEERAMLADVAERVRAAGALVTFFGKSFDRHRLEDKMRVHGIAPPFDGVLHLDLYHPLRRLYGKALPDGRLATLERELVGLARVGDLPGSQAPAAWFDYLAGREHRLEQVFEHNRLDVLSLAALLAHLGRTLDETRPDGAPLEGGPIARARALSELFEKERAVEDALAWCERALARIAALPADVALRIDGWRSDVERRKQRLERRLARSAASAARRAPREQRAQRRG